MDRLQLSPSVLSWAAREAGMTLPEVATRLTTRKQQDILEGRLTEPQATKLSKLTGVPLGFLFLSDPPAARQLPITDFRTLQHADPLSRDFFETLDDIQFKQDWYRDHLVKMGADPLPFIGSFALSSATPQKIADDISKWLDLAALDRSALSSTDDLYGEIAARAENIGVLVFKNGVVGNNGSRRLSVREFRGFALSDPLAPVIFVNGADAAPAWVFTLAHELAHLWLGHSGVSDVSPHTADRQERLCNAVAGELLVPKRLFLAFWKAAAKELGFEPLQAIDAGKRRFRVSELVIARRALDLDLIDIELYQGVYAANRRRASGGGDFYRTLSVRNSKTFSAKVASLAASGSISFREASRLLRIAPNRVMNIYKRQRALPSGL